jgi:hypothetical protein
MYFVRILFSRLLYTFLCLLFIQATKPVPELESTLNQDSDLDREICLEFDTDSYLNLDLDQDIDLYFGRDKDFTKPTLKNVVTFVL